MTRRCFIAASHAAPLEAKIYGWGNHLWPDFPGKAAVLDLDESWSGPVETRVRVSGPDGRLPAPAPQSPGNSGWNTERKMIRYHRTRRVKKGVSLLLTAQCKSRCFHIGMDLRSSFFLGGRNVSRCLPSTVFLWLRAGVNILLSVAGFVSRTTLEAGLRKVLEDFSFSRADSLYCFAVVKPIAVETVFNRRLPCDY